MSDEQTPPSPTPSDGGADGLVPADELAAVMAEASASADVLSRELGTPPNVATSLHDDTSDLDAQLDELERLVERAGRELDERFLGQNKMSPTELGEALAQSIDEKPLETPDEQVLEEVPDFMSEFTSPAETPAPDVEKQDTAPAPPPGVVGTPDTFEKPPPPPLDPEPEAPEPVARKFDPREKLVSALHRAGKLASPIAQAACEKVLVGLDMTDRPLQRFGDRGRLLVGWFGLATFGTAMVVYLFSLL